MTGSCYERRAAEFLREKGLEIVEMNFRCRIGEIDLVARDGRYLVFVEVKYRSTKRQGTAVDAVGKEKQRVISKIAAYYLLTHCKNMDVPCRFDVVGIEGGEIHWIPNAFEYCP